MVTVNLPLPGGGVDTRHNDERLNVHSWELRIDSVSINAVQGVIDEETMEISVAPFPSGDAVDEVNEKGHVEM